MIGGALNELLWYRVLGKVMLYLSCCGIECWDKRCYNYGAVVWRAGVSGV